jgi:acetyl-CoA C-acetyltransferase
MKLDNVAVPLGLGWSSPFTRWQGALSELSSIDLAVDVTGRALSTHGVDPGEVHTATPEGLTKLAPVTPDGVVTYGSQTHPGDGADAEGAGPAARAALADVGLDIADIDVVTTHNPFAVNDLYFHRQTGFPLEGMNPYGSSLVYGHPQGPTGPRAIVELIEALRARGGGRGLFTGCAAGAVVVEVG